MKNLRFKIKWKIFWGKPVSDEELLYLFRQQDFKRLYHISLSPENEVLMVNFNSFELFKCFVRYRALREPAQLAILDNEEFFKYYVGLRELDDAVECELIRRNNADFIRYYIDLYGLSDEAEKIMLDVCSRDVIVPYIRMHGFGSVSLLKLIRSNNEFLIKTYIDWHPIKWRTAQVALIESGNEEVIKSYICRNNLSDDAEVELINSQNEELIKLYLKGHKLSRSAKIALLETENVRLFELYVANHT